MTTYLKRVADDWVFSHSQDDEIGGYRDPLFILEIIIQSSPHWGWLLLLEIINLDKEEVSTDDLVAGPFASWIALHANKWIETVETEAQENARLRQVLARLTRNDLDSSTWKRIENAQETPNSKK